MKIFSLKKLISLFICTAIIITALPLNFGISASAETEGMYTYTVSSGEATITDCNTSASGSIAIPSTLGGYPVTSIGAVAFYNCRSLTSVTIGNSVTNIGSYAFYGCDWLKSVTIGDSVTIIGDRVFLNCYRLTSINVDADNTAYASEDGVLFNKDKTTLICYPAGKTAASYIIPDSVTSIGSSAFYNCTSLTSVTIPDSVTSIGAVAFYNCTSLTSVTIPDSVTSIGDDAFESCTSLTSINIDADNTAYTLVDGVLFNKNKTILICYPAGKTAASYIIPDSVTSIGSSAFSYCTSLTSVTIGNGVISIGNSAFYECTKLTSIVIPDSVTSIGTWAFSYCTSLTSVTIGNSVTSIGDSAFKDCTSLTSVTIPDSVTSIGDDAFESCTSLTSITIPDSVTSIGTGAFSYCTWLTSVTIGNGVTSIGDYTFYKCTSLTSVTIGNSVTSIGEDAFYNCTSLATVYYSGNEKQWNNITISSGNTNLENATRYYNYYNNVYQSGFYMFGFLNGEATLLDCNVTVCGDIVIPDTIRDYPITSIGDEAFYGCTKLTSIVIPDSVTSIGDYAFYNCKKLWHVLYAGTKENWDSIVIGLGNSDLENATRHYGASGDEITSKIIKPTCTKQGYTRCFCGICEEEYLFDYTSIVEHDYEISEVIEPTCTEQGYTKYRCSVCGEELISDYLPAGHSYEIMMVLNPTCEKQGYTLYRCTDCYHYSSSDYTDMVPHSFVDGICGVCGLCKDDLIESAHNYVNNCNETWVINKPDAESISIMFSADTKTENGWDYIYIYDMNDNLIGKYSGTTLASQTITVQGDTVKIKLTSDSSNTYYGFAITNIQVNYIVDIDGDGVLGAEDLLAMQKAILGVIEVDENNPGAYDLTKDGIFDLRDLLRLKLMMAGMVTG